MVAEHEKRVIRENPHLTEKVLANFLGLRITQVNNQRRLFDSGWTYSGVGFPRMDVLRPSRNNKYIRNRFKIRYIGMTLFQGDREDAINVHGQFLHMLENGMNPHRAPRVIKPVLTINDKFRDGIERVLNER